MLAGQALVYSTLLVPLHSSSLGCKYLWLSLLHII